MMEFATKLASLPEAHGGTGRARLPSRPAISMLLGAALDHAPVGLIVLRPDHTVQHVTRPAATLLGLPDDQVFVDQTLVHLLEHCPAIEASGTQEIGDALSTADADPRQVLLSLGRVGSRYEVAIDIRRAGDQGWVLTIEDVTQTRQTQDWLLEHASTDPVTGLWNRQHFMLMLQDSLAEAREGRVEAPCLVLIGTRQRSRSESIGTVAADAVLRMIGDRLAGILRDDDMLARFGAEEFALALTRPGGRAGVRAVCARLQAGLAKPCVVEGHTILVDASIGVALAPGDGLTPETLAANAGLALQAAGVGIEPGPRFFEAAMTERAQHRRALEVDLREALGRGEFELHYQPQVDVLHSRVTGMEALIRWRSPERGLVPPAAFITLAEQIGLICDIGNWVLNEACHEAVRWPDDVTVAINASPLQFETGSFASSVAEALSRSGLPARRLEVEVTENLLLRDTGRVLATLAALERMGVRLVLDDFGTGYASLSQLSRFRFDKIKIDRSFVSPAEVSFPNSAIVRSIAALGTSLGIPTTAEGVETATQLEQIKADGCTCVQGYFFSRPVPSVDVSAMMRRLDQRPLLHA